MAKKINTAALKEFLFNHGEKVALGTCAFLALVFGVMGMIQAMGAGKADGSSKNYVDDFTENARRVREKMASQGPPVLPDDVKRKMDSKEYVWGPVQSNHAQQPYVINAEPNASKRTQPIVLPILAKNSKQIQLDYIRGLAFVHEVEKGSLACLEAEGDAQAPIQPGPGTGPGPKRKPKDGGPQGSMAIPPVMRKGEPVHMVVVSAVFPMQAQVAEFQKALRMATQEDMFKIPREDLPFILGINVLKYEIVGGKRVEKTDWKDDILIYVDPSTNEKVKDKKVTVAPALDELLRTAIYDYETAEMLKEHIWHGLVTPMPKLGNARYPKFKFDGLEFVDFDEDEPKVADGKEREPKPKNEGQGLGKGRNPKKPPPGSDPMKQQPNVVYKERLIPYKTVLANEPALALRLFPKEKESVAVVNKYNIFHVLGVDPPSKEEGAVLPPGNRPPAPNVPGKKGDGNGYFDAWDFGLPNVAGGAGPQPPPAPKDKKGEWKVRPEYPNWDRDALVRFVDPGAVPGKTYQYAVQVRMANPNFGKNINEVAFGDLTRFEELPPSDWVLTPTITIPGEYFVYAVDQKPDPKAPVNPGKTPPVKLDKDHTAFQIHQWTDRVPDLDNDGPGLVIGDWVIAERIVVRRGEAIGSQIEVRAPVWSKLKNAFEMPMIKYEPVKGRPTPAPKPGFRMDFKPEGERPILVDFVGGKRLKTDGKTLDEDTAVDALVLTPDGKLTVLNSRTGEFAVENERPGQPPEQALLVTRQERVERARSAADAALPQVPVDPKGGKLGRPGG